MHDCLSDWVILMHAVGLTRHTSGRSYVRHALRHVYKGHATGSSMVHPVTKKRRSHGDGTSFSPWGTWRKGRSRCIASLKDISSNIPAFPWKIGWEETGKKAECGQRISFHFLVQAIIVSCNERPRFAQTKSACKKVISMSSSSFFSLVCFGISLLTYISHA